MLVAASEQGICTIAFADQADELHDLVAMRFSNAELKQRDAELSTQVRVLVNVNTTYTTNTHCGG